MNLTSENIILIGSILLLISIFAGKTTYKYGVPTLLLFLTIGMLAGSDGIGQIRFDDPKAAQFIGIVSLNFILFSGGLDTSWSSVKPVLWQGLILSSGGVLLTAFILGGFVYSITNFSFYESMLLGSIVSSTDAAAVFSILRSKSLALKKDLRPMLEFESGSNDPMAYVLTIAFLGLVQNENASLFSVVPIFFKQMIIGGIAGFGFGYSSKQVINKIRLDYEGLYFVLVIALMYLTFSTTDFIGGNGFLAVYICGVFLGNSELIHKKTILKTYDGIAWLMQIVLFLTLGLLVYPSHLLPVAGIGALVSVFLMLVARPVSVWLCLLPFKMRRRRRIYIAWVGLRGAVPIVFATYPLLAGIEKAEMIFNIVFFISVSSVLIQGTSLTVVAKWLGVSLPEKLKPKAPLEIFLSEHAKTVMREIEIDEGSFPVGKQIVELNFPKSAIIAMIKRGENYITPSGSTVIEAKDILIVLSDTEEVIEKVYDSLRLFSNSPLATKKSV